jgi:hypothetical protein
MDFAVTDDSFDQTDCSVQENGRFPDGGTQKNTGARFQHLLIQHWVFRDRYGEESDSHMIDHFGSIFTDASRFVDHPDDYISLENIEKRSHQAREYVPMGPRTRVLLEQHWRPVLEGINGPDRYIHAFFLNRQPTITSQTQLLDVPSATAQEPASTEPSSSPAIPTRAGPRAMAPRFLRLYKDHWLHQSRASVAEHVEAAAAAGVDRTAPPPKLTNKLLPTKDFAAAAPLTEVLNDSGSGPAPPCAEILHNRDRRASAAATPPAQASPPPPPPPPPAEAAAPRDGGAEGASGTMASVAPLPPPAGTLGEPPPRASVA